MKTRKILAVLLTIVMVLGLCSMASAAAPNDMVQINNMKIDKSLVDLAAFGLEEEAEAEPVAALSVASTTDLEQDENYPPISRIEIEGFDEDELNSMSMILQGWAAYFVTVPAGTEDEDLTDKNVTFILGGTSSTQEGSTIEITYNDDSRDSVAGGSITFPMTLLDGEAQIFTISWTTRTGEHREQNGRITVEVPVDETDVSLTSLTIADTEADISSSTVGGVTRYVCTAELENVTSLNGLEVVAELGSENANAKLNNVSGAKDGSTVTFSNVDLSTSKDLVVTNTTYSRTYQVSAHIKDGTVTVHIAIRSFLADEWLNGRTNWYAGYTGNGLTQSNRESLLATAAYLRSANSPTTSSTVSDYNGNAPISVASNGRYIFSEASYVTLTVPADYKVRDALDCFVGLKDNAQGERETYFSSFSIQGSSSYIEAMGQTSSSVIGEFDCGYASGWMYTARTARDDVTTALPDAGANTWPVSNGMYIDWYYTADYGADFGYSMFG